MDVHSPLLGGRVHPPDFIHQLSSGEDFIGVGHQLIEKIEFLLGQQGDLLAARTVRAS